MGRRINEKGLQIVRNEVAIRIRCDVTNKMTPQFPFSIDIIHFLRNGSRLYQSSGVGLTQSECFADVTLV